MGAAVSNTVVMPSAPQPLPNNPWFQYVFTVLFTICCAVFGYVFIVVRMQTQVETLQADVTELKKQLKEDHDYMKNLPTKEDISYVDTTMRARFDYIDQKIDRVLERSR